VVAIPGLRDRTGDQSYFETRATQLSADLRAPSFPLVVSHA
jgi:hypothetical protein